MVRGVFRLGVPVIAVMSLVAILPAQSAAAAVPGSFNGQFMLKFDNSQKCLDDPDFAATDDTPLQQYTCNGGGNQNWYLYYITSTTFRIEGESSNLCLNVKGGKYVDDTPIILWTCNNSANEVFQYQDSPLEEPPYEWDWIEPASAPSMSLNVQSGSTANDAKIILYSASDSTNEWIRTIAPPRPPAAPPTTPCSSNPAYWRAFGQMYNAQAVYSDWTNTIAGAGGEEEVQYEWGDGGVEHGLIWTGIGPCAGLQFDDRGATKERFRTIDDECHCVTEDQTPWANI